MVQVLTQQADYQTARKYWNQLRGRFAKEGSESVTSCHRLKLPAADGKNYLTDVATAETLLRIVQSVPSPRPSPSSSGWPRWATSACRRWLTPHCHLAELSTRQIAESAEATGMAQNKSAAQTGGRIARQARNQLESQTGKSLVTGANDLSPVAPPVESAEQPVKVIKAAKAVKAPKKP